MILKDKTILIMGIRNKWSIAYGIAESAYKQGAKLIFTYMGEENKEKIEKLTEEFENSKAYVLDGVSSYSLVLTARVARELDMLKENASIVTLTYLGSTKVLDGYNVMGIAKSALEASVRYLASNLGKYGVRINAISSGPIKTLSAKGIKDFNSILNVVEEKSPLHRNVTIEQIGDVATFLLSKMSEAITGQIIYADSGYCIMGN